MLATVLGTGLTACGDDQPRPKTAYGPEGVAVQQGTPLAPPGRAAETGRTVRDLRCLEPTTPDFHVHSHLAVYVDGELRPIPAGIGMVDPQRRHTRTGPLLNGPDCYYGLHVHAQDGVIHVESGRDHHWTLGDFFALWGQPLGRERVGPARGPVTAYVDGRPSLLDPGAIPLRQRTVIQLDVGSPRVPPEPVDWSHF